MTGLGKVLNALLPQEPALPAMDLVGPTADDDIRRAISRYGAEAVKGAVKKQTARKIGRPKVNDWKELRAIIEDDATIWLEGNDPFGARSNYSIAKAVADENPGHSHPATMKRIQRKLSASPHGRVWFTLVSAWMKSEKAYPFSAYLRTLKELRTVDPDGMWDWYLKRAEGALADYTMKHGNPPESLTLKEIEDGARAPLNALLGFDSSQPRRGGLFGLAGISPANSLAGLAARYPNVATADE